MANIKCEICGKGKARAVRAPSGGTMDACKPCEKRENRQAALDAQWDELADTLLAA